MADLNVKWTGGLQFLATDNAGRVVVTDGQGQGFAPPNLLLASIVGCAGVDVVRILEKKRKKLSSIEVSISKRNAPDPPWLIERIDIEWTVRGQGLTEKAVLDAVHLSETKYCSVTASLKSEIVSTVRIINENDPSTDSG
jgi:putative redox protein